MKIYEVTLVGKVLVEANNEEEAKFLASFVSNTHQTEVQNVKCLDRKGLNGGT